MGEDREMSKIPIEEGLIGFVKQLIFFLGALGNHCCCKQLYNQFLF